MAGPDAADLAELAVSELFTNAVLYTRSGRPGGTVTVIISGGHGGVEVHLHDLGAVGSAVPRPRHAIDAAGEMAEGGRGLLLVESVSAEFGVQRVADCRHSDADALATARSGSCVRFCLASLAGRRAGR